MPEKLSKNSFSKSLNTSFRLHTDADENFEFELIELQDGYSTPGQEQFSIKFRGPCNLDLPQKTYLMEHDHIGTFDLFIVPIGRDKTGSYYEAIFNRLIE